MSISDRTLDNLARTWLAEAKRLRSSALCDCGCGEAIPVNRTRFKSGHDAKLLSRYRKLIREALADPKW